MAGYKWENKRIWSSGVWSMITIYKEQRAFQEDWKKKFRKVAD